MIHKRRVILDIYKDDKANFLDVSTILAALENRGYNFSKRRLSNFIRNSLEHTYLIPSKGPEGAIIGWRLIRQV